MRPRHPQGAGHTLPVSGYVTLTPVCLVSGLLAGTAPFKVLRRGPWQSLLGSSHIYSMAIDRDCCPSHPDLACFLLPQVMWLKTAPNYLHEEQETR